MSYFKSPLPVDIFRLGYNAAAEMSLQNAARILKNEINKSFQSAGPLSWPITASQLENFKLPKNVTFFLNELITGRPAPELNKKQERLVNSIGQDICRAATNGKWKLPKHILMAMSLRHLFRSANLNILMNRMGHAESYSFALELETALATYNSSNDSLLDSKVVKSPNIPYIIHSDWDNFDKNLSSLLGPSSIHVTHGILMQDLVADIKDIQQLGTVHKLRQTNRTGDRSIDIRENELQPLIIPNKSRAGPRLHMEYTPAYSEVNDVRTASLKLMLHGLIRYHASTSGTVAPNLSGYISAISQPPKRLTTIQYYPVVNHPITEYSTIRECLRISTVATEEVGQKYVINTFDLDAAIKALPIIWKEPDIYKNHIILPGTMHIMMSCFRILMKKMSGAGIEDLLLEAGLLTTGSLRGVITGKNYYRAMHCHLTLAEALRRLLFDRYLSSHEKDNNMFQWLDRLLRNCSGHEVENVLRDSDVKKFMDKYMEFESEIRQGKQGSTPQFWLQYLDFVKIIELLYYAVKRNEFNVYTHCLHEMAAKFFSFKGHNYARYLSYFSVFMINLHESHPGATDILRRGAISVARSFILGNREDIDKTIEETYNRHAKSHSGQGSDGFGVSGLMLNLAAYRRWCHTTHERVQFLEALLEVNSMSGKENSISPNLTSLNMSRSEKQVQKTIAAIESFMNPFDTDLNADNKSLYVLSSGQQVPVELEDSILKADARGIEARDDFMKHRLVEKSVEFFLPITKQKRINLDELNKVVKLTTVDKHLIEVRQTTTIALELINNLACDQLQDIMKYPLMPIPSSIGTADGYLVKNVKSKLRDVVLNGIETVPSRPDPKNTLVIVDGNVVYHQLRDLPPTFGEICTKIFDISTSGNNFTVFSTDSYDTDSIKSLERKRRGTAPSRILSGPNMLKPSSMSAFLSNDQNKEQFSKLMLKLWTNENMVKKLDDRCVLLVVNGSAHEIKLDGQNVISRTVDYLNTTQEETDTKVVLYWKYAEKNNLKNVVIKTTDSDIFFICLYHAYNYKSLNIFLETSVEGQKRLINITSLASKLGHDFCSALLGLHAFTGADCTSGFKGIGKIRPYKKFLKYAKFQDAFGQLGEGCLSPETISKLETFTCKLYRDTSETSIDRLRYSMLKMDLDKIRRTREKSAKSKRNIDLSRLPPPQQCLEEHIKRVEYQVAIWKNADVQYPVLANTDNGWRHAENGLVEPNWYKGDILPMDWLACLSNEKNTDDRGDTDTDDESESDASECPDEIDSDDESDDEL